MGLAKRPQSFGRFGEMIERPQQEHSVRDAVAERELARVAHSIRGDRIRGRRAATLGFLHQPPHRIDEVHGVSPSANHSE